MISIRMIVGALAAAAAAAAALLVPTVAASRGSQPSADLHRDYRDNDNTIIIVIIIIIARVVSDQCSADTKGEGFPKSHNFIKKIKLGCIIMPNNNRKT